MNNDLPLSLEIALLELDGREPRKHDDRAAQIRKQLRELPETLSSVIREVRSHFGRERLLDVVASEVERRGTPFLKPAEVGTDDVTLAFAHLYLPAIHRERILGEIANDVAFLGHLKRSAHEYIELAHRAGVWTSRSVPHLRAPQRPSGNLWQVRTDMGLGTASHPEGLPEQLALWLAAQAARSRQAAVVDVGLDSDEPRVVLNWGAGPSTIAWALEAFAPNQDIKVHEVDTIGQATSKLTAWRAPFIPTLTDLHRHEITKPQVLSDGHLPYDYIVCHVPPPAGEGANQLRNAYKDMQDRGGRARYGFEAELDKLIGKTQTAQEDKHAERSWPDVGRYGVKRWKPALTELVKDMAGVAPKGTEIAFVLPLGVRVRAREGGFAYDANEGLLSGVCAFMESVGLEVIENFDVTEPHPVPQPQCNMNRCPWRCVITRKAA